MAIGGLHHLVLRVSDLGGAEERLDHVALALDLADRDAIRDRTGELDCEYGEKGDAVFVTDRHEVEWKLNASSPRPETPFETLDV